MAKCRSRACKLRRAQNAAAQVPNQPTAQLVPAATTGSLSDIGNGGLQTQSGLPQLVNQPWSAAGGATGMQAGPTNVPGQKETWREWFLGRPESSLQFPLYNADQSNAFQWALRQGLQGLAQNNGFGPIADQARENFREQTIPSIAERFTALGAQGSSAFPQQLSQAGRGLETDLAALQAGYNQDQQRMMLSLLGLGLSPQYETAYSPRSAGFLGNTSNALAQGVGQGLTGGWIGSGLNALSNLSSAFRRVPGNFST